MTEKHSDQVRYIAAVLWCHGDSEQRIADALSRAGFLGMTKGVISGIITRAGDGELRNLGSMEARQSWLTRLRRERLDKGLLAERHFTAAPILGGQRR